VTAFGEWTQEYVKLVQTQRELKEFIGERYEHYLRVVAHEYFDKVAGVEAIRHEPCHDCRVEVSTLIEDDNGWYFEWNCRGGYTGSGCSASGEGWYVPLPVVEGYLAAHAVT
jgi:hypothetical protein